MHYLQARSRQSDCLRRPGDTTRDGLHEPPVSGGRTMTSGLRHHRIATYVEEVSYASKMVRTTPTPANRLILTGYLILALSSLVSFINNVRLSHFFDRTDFRFLVQVFLSPVAALATALGWWFLCRLEAQDSRQQSLFAKAYAGLGVGFAVSCIIQLSEANTVIFGDTYSWPFWLTLVGFGVGAAGYFLTASAMAKSKLVSTDANRLH